MHINYNTLVRFTMLTTGIHSRQLLNGPMKWEEKVCLKTKSLRKSCRNQHWSMKRHRKEEEFHDMSAAAGLEESPEELCLQQYKLFFFLYFRRRPE